MEEDEVEDADELTIIIIGYALMLNRHFRHIFTFLP